MGILEDRATQLVGAKIALMQAESMYTNSAGGDSTYRQGKLADAITVIEQLVATDESEYPVDVVERVKKGLRDRGLIEKTGTVLNALRMDDAFHKDECIVYLKAVREILTKPV